MNEVSKRPRRSGRPSNPVPREKLIETAQQVFARLGYSGASMEEIARRSGLRKASLFHHFSSKSRLYSEALGAATTDLGNLVAKAAFQEGTFLEKLDALGDAVVVYLGENPLVARLLVREIVDGGRFLGGPGAEQVKMVLAAIGEFLNFGIDQREIPPQDTAQLAASIIGTHLFYFAASDLSSELTGEDIFGATMIETRRAVVREQVRRLCGVQAVKSASKE